MGPRRFYFLKIDNVEPEDIGFQEIIPDPNEIANDPKQAYKLWSKPNQGYPLYQKIGQTPYFTDRPNAKRPRIIETVLNKFKRRH